MDYRQSEDRRGKDSTKVSYQHPNWRKDELYYDDRKPIAKCHYCKRDIKGESDNFYADEAYVYDGIWCCEDCKDEFLKMFKV